MFLLIVGILFSLTALVSLAAYFITDSKRPILARLAGVSAILAIIIWVLDYTLTALSSE